MIKNDPRRWFSALRHLPPNFLGKQAAFAVTEEATSLCSISPMKSPLLLHRRALSRATTHICLWLAVCALPIRAQEIDVDKDPALQEKLVGMKKRVFATIQLSDLEEKFPSSGDLNLRRAAIHKARKWFEDDSKMQIDCALLELDVDVAQNNMKLVEQHLGELRKAYVAKMKPEQAARGDYFEGLVEMNKLNFTRSKEVFGQVARNKSATGFLRMNAYRNLAEALVTDAKPAEAAKILAEATKNLDADVAPMLEPIKAGVLILIGQRDQARRVWKQSAEQFGANSGPIYNVGLQMVGRAMWTPIGEEILTIMAESAKKLPFTKEVDTAVAELKQKLQQVSKAGLLVIALNQERQGQYQQAIATYAKIPPTDPSFVPALLYKGILLHELGRSAEGVSTYAEISKLPFAGNAASEPSFLEFQSTWGGGTPLQSAYAKRAMEWWPEWEKLAAKIGLKLSADSALGAHLFEDWKAKSKTEVGLRPDPTVLAALARWSRWNPGSAGDFADILRVTVENNQAQAEAALSVLFKLEQTMAPQLKRLKAGIIEQALRLRFDAKLAHDRPEVSRLVRDFLDLQELPADESIRTSMECGTQALLDQELLLPAVTRLEQTLSGLRGKNQADYAKAVRQLLALLYLAQGKEKESEQVLQSDSAWPLTAEFANVAQKLKGRSGTNPIAITGAEIQNLLSKQAFASKNESMLGSLAGETTPVAQEATKAGPYGPSLKATMAQVQPVWFEFITPENLKEEAFRDEKKFFTTEDPNIALWNRMKGALLYAVDPDQTEATRRSGVLISAACAYNVAKTASRLQPWMPLSLTKSMNDPLNYSVEMGWLQSAVSSGSPALAQRLLSTLKSAASQPVHDSRLESIVKQNEYFLELYNLSPDDASVSAFRKKILATPLDNERAQLIGPTLTFLLHHGQVKAAATWRETALAALANDPENAKKLGSMLDALAQQANTWRPVHEALCAVLWKHVDKGGVTKPREVDEVLNQSNVGLEFSAETLRNIYFYYLKKGGLFWQISHWQHLLADALPNDDKWGALKRDLCAKALEVAPTDELRTLFASRYAHYFPLEEAANRERLKDWVKPYSDLKKHPLMGQVARWVDLNNAFATMDQAAMQTLSAVPQDTADGMERHWRTVAAVAGRGQVADTTALLKDLPEAAFAPFMYQGIMLCALKLIKDDTREVKVRKDARANAKALLGRIWVSRDLELLPVLIDLVDALDEKELLPEPFIKEMRVHPYLPVSAPASAWFYAINKSWGDCKTAAEVALKTTEGDTFNQPQMWLLLGFAESHLGHKPQAAIALEMFLKRAPSSIHYQTAADLLARMKE